MTADSYLELVLVFMGWLINNALWIIITTTGIFAIPLAFKIASVWLKVREEGDDEGNKGALALPRMEHVLYVAFVVMMFCAMPMWDVDMLSCLEHLCHLHVELVSGKCWFPLVDAPPEPYRFRFIAEFSPERQQSYGAMLAWRVIPSEAIGWLSTWPEAVKTLSTYLTGFRAQSGVVNSIVSEAIRLSLGTDANPTPTTFPLHIVTEQVLFGPAGVLLPSDSVMPTVPGTELLAVEAGGATCELVSIQETELLPAAHLHGEADDTDALLAMMGMNHDDTEEQIQPDVQDDIGTAFWQWLIAGCRSGSFTVNKPDARVHLVAGFVFLRTPGIFHQFLSETGAEKEDKAQLQRLFEKLGHHRQDNGSMYACHLYQNELYVGRFQKLNGYLVVASKIFAGDNIPEDNSLLVVI